MKKILLILLILLGNISRTDAQMRPGQVDIFAGVDFNYRDIYFNGRLFDLLVYLTAGIKWNMGHRWEASAQVFIPIINQYGDSQSGKVRLNMLSLSKQLSAGNRFRFKFSGGLFGSYRYGLDVKTMFIAREWLALVGEIGLTGYCSLADGWDASTMDRLTWLAGTRFWLKRWNTQFDITGGRFIYTDYGIKADGWRHFKHVSVGAWVGYSNKLKKNGGFKVLVMLPPYKRTRRKVNFRPASNFGISYQVEAGSYYMREYDTEPEQNERSGWFDPDMLPWGPDTMAPDFISREKKKSNTEPVDSMSVSGKEVTR